MGDEAKRIIDLVDGIQGTWVKTVTEGVTADNPNLDNPCRIKYVPDIDVFKHPKQAFRMIFFGHKPIVTSNKVYPKEAVEHKVLESTEEGVPERVVIITEDERGRSPLLEQVDKEMSAKVSKMEEQLNEAEKDSMLKDIDKMESEDKQNRDEQQPNKPRSSRRKGGKDGNIRRMFDR